MQHQKDRLTVVALILALAGCGQIKKDHGSAAPGNQTPDTQEVDTSGLPPADTADADGTTAGATLETSKLCPQDATYAKTMKVTAADGEQAVFSTANTIIDLVDDKAAVNITSLSKDLDAVSIIQEGATNKVTFAFDKVLGRLSIAQVNDSGTITGTVDDPGKITKIDWSSPGTKNTTTLSGTGDYTCPAPAPVAKAAADPVTTGKGSKITCNPKAPKKK